MSVVIEATKTALRNPDKPSAAMSMEARARRRRLVAEAITNRLSVQQVCEQFDCSAHLVKRACSEHGVSIPRRAPHTFKVGKTLEILARLLRPQPRETFGTIARDLEIQRQRVDQVYREAMRVGFKMDRWQQASNRTPRTVKP